MVLGGVGAALLVLGLKKKRAAGVMAQVQAAPVFGRDQVGLALGGRF